MQLVIDQKTQRELLLGWLRVGNGEISADKLERLSTADWDKIVDLAHKQGIIPMLYHRFWTSKAREHIPTKKYKLINSIYCTLFLTKRMLKAEIPDELLNELKSDTLDRQLIDLAEERIWGTKSSSQIARAAVDALSSRKVLDKLKVTMRYLFPSRRTVGNVSPVSEDSIFIYPFYLFYHLRFIKRYWSFLWGFVRHDRSVLSEFELEKWISSL